MADTYTKGTRVWFPDKEVGWVSGEVTNVVKSGDALKLTFVDERGREVVVDTTEKDVKEAKEGSTTLPPLRNPPVLETPEDLATLSHLNEPSVLHAIRSRYAQHEIYTYSGIVLIAVNPFQRVSLYGPEAIQSYTVKNKMELDPHLFAIAQEAHVRMRKDNIGQTIIVSGESGAGKTESAKLIMRFLASVTGSDNEAPRTKSLDESSEVERQMLATNPILEAFGNAKTARNDNSSRFGKYLQILFDGKHEIVGARIRTYLLERSRLVYQPEIERNYHIFYQLCAGAPAKEKKDLGLDDIHKFFYLNQGGPNATPIAGVDDAEEFRATQSALSTVGVSVEKQWAVFRLLAALLHLGNIKITAMRNDAVMDDNDPALLLATKLLGLSPVEFKKWTVKKQITTRSEKIVTSLNAAQATIVRDSVAKFIYSCLFEWLIFMVNESLAGENGESERLAECFIGVLDIYGFEHYPYKGPSRAGATGTPGIANSFEQFCINYANEKLQQEFNAHVFKLEQEEYVREQINWTFIDYSDNQPCIDVIEGKLGILALLDEESRLPSGSDASFLTKLNTQLAIPANKDIYKKPRFGNSAFTIAHYAVDVTYEVEGFLEKNRDTVPDEQLAILSATRNIFLKDVLDAALAPPKAAIEPQPSSPSASDTASVGSRRSSVIPDPARLSVTLSGAGSTVGGVSTAATAKRPGAVARKPTLGSIFKGSLASLMETIGMTNAHYIRCIKPNEQKRAWEFTPQQVLSQLRACGVLETIRISCAGYPSRWTYDEFALRYYMLVPSTNWRPTPADPKTLCNTILGDTIKEEDKYQQGLTKIFFRAGMLALLESRRSARLNELVTLIQKNVKRRLAVQHYQSMRSAAIKIQTWWRGILARRFVLGVRKETMALKLQRAARAFVQRSQFRAIRRSVVAIQSYARGMRARQAMKTQRITVAATTLQSLFRGLLSRRSYKSDVKHVIWMQSCIRRRYARRQLKVLRTEARSASKFKEISYKLENKVVELTQNLQSRTAEKKELQSKLTDMERQLQSWVTKHEEMDAKAKQLQADMQTLHVPKARFDELLEAKKSIDGRLEESARRVAQQDEEIRSLTAELERQTQEMEAKVKAAAAEATSKAPENTAGFAALKAELSTLRDQLNRANALNALTRTREPPSPGLKTFDSVSPLNGINAATAVVNGNSNGHRRRHSSAGIYGIAGFTGSDPADFIETKRSQNPRAVSVAYNGLQEPPRFRGNGLSNIYDDPSEEKVKLLEDAERLDQDVLDGLIRTLKIPVPNLTNPPSIREVLFPANLIALITNEMWKFGLIPESERFLANVMQTIQAHVMSFTGEDAIVPGVFWLSNVQELLSFICTAENDMLQGIGPGGEPAGREFDWADYERLVSIVKHDLDSLEYNIYHTWMLETKKRLNKMVIPALIESQSLPGFTTTDGGGRLFNRLLNSNSQPAFSMDNVLNLLNKVWTALKSFYMEESVVQQVVVELLRLVGVTSFNDLLMRRNFCSWKRAMQIQYNITRIEEWCKSHDMPEGTLQLEHLMQATKLLQLKKASSADIQIIYDVCWILTPLQIQRMCSNYFVADYEHPISPEILRVVASRVIPNDKTDHLLLSPEGEEVGPYELPLPRDIAGLETYVPSYLNVPHVRRLASLVE